ncbi:phosphatase PAP2 family protein [Enterovibrio sp. ZSDZ35]|uniref:Phosphatase PAP2 family protein n=1 Tax=Enterovibrio qingdaonensis TaxID=2899818 RepID=A0ABT5QQ57_9GAMM|nr:phosphatase PAP2 family protein [Enterovibrio sp. ZSDZ35]MDD1783112.1 phosphatase PAP2 family protein [Enterovibrio sp. ZSDZ35]
MSTLYPLILLASIWLFFFAQLSTSINWQFVSDVGAYGLVTTAIAFPVFYGEWQELQQALLIIACASAIGLLGKLLISAKRPDLSGNDSFPSNHTANAVAASTALMLCYGWFIGLLSYGLAVCVGLGRVKAFKHHWRDVVVGLGVGLVAAVIAVKYM